MGLANGLGLAEPLQMTCPPHPSPGPDVKFVPTQGSARLSQMGHALSSHDPKSPGLDPSSHLSPELPGVRAGCPQVPVGTDHGAGPLSGGPIFTALLDSRDPGSSLEAPSPLPPLVHLAVMFQKAPRDPAAWVL